jgi:hypothetical protein
MELFNLISMTNILALQIPGLNDTGQKIQAGALMHDDVENKHG